MLSPKTPSIPLLLLCLAPILGGVTAQGGSDEGQIYQCHANCGYTILDSSLSGHCDNSTWTDLLEDCLSCAEETDIWSDYKDGVQAAAEGCGIDGTPDASDSDDSSSSSSSSASPTTSPTGTSTPPSSTSSPTTTTTDSTTTPTGTGSPDSKAAGSLRPDSVVTAAAAVVLMGMMM